MEFLLPVDRASSIIAAFLLQWISANPVKPTNVTLNETTTDNFTTTATTVHPHDTLEFSIWTIAMLSLTCFFSIMFILCGLFGRADAYRMPFVNTLADEANRMGYGGDDGQYGMQADGGM